MRVTPARLDDADDVRHLAELRAAWYDPAVTESFHAEFARWLTSERDSRVAWFAEDDGGRVGMVSLKRFTRMPSPGRPPSSWGYLANLFVVDEFRGRGAGGLLIDAVVEQARAEGMVRLVLSPSAESIPLYARHGFRPAAELLVRQL